MSSAITEQQTTAALELIAFGMPAEIVVIVEDKYLRSWSGKFAEEVSGGKTTDTPAHYYEIVRFLVVDRIWPCLAIAHRMHHFPGAVMASAHPGFRRGIVGGIFFRSVWCSISRHRFQPCRTAGRKRGADRDRASVQEIAACDLAIHSQCTVPLFTHSPSLRRALRLRQS